MATKPKMPIMQKPMKPALKVPKMPIGNGLPTKIPTVGSIIPPRGKTKGF